MYGQCEKVLIGVNRLFPMQHTCEKPICFYVVLHSTLKNTEISRQLALGHPPRTIAEFKRTLQDKFNIPAYSQNLTFQSAVLKDDDLFQSYNFRDGDEIRVEYPVEVDVWAILETVAGMRDLVSFLRSIKMDLDSKNGIKRDLTEQISQELTKSKVMNLDSLLGDDVSEWKEKSTFFIHHEGLQLIHQLHSILLEQPWDCVCHIELLSLERILLNATHQIGSVYLDIKVDVHTRHEILKFLSLKNVLKSLLRVKVSPRKHIKVPSNKKLAAGTKQSQLTHLTQVIFFSASALCT